MVPTDGEIAVVPANQASWQDLQLIFGQRGDPATCQCQWFHLTRPEWRGRSQPDLERMLHEQTACGHPDASSTTGLVAYLNGEPVGWCAVEPRANYVRLRSSRVVWSGRHEDPDDATVWSVSCFVTRTGFRRRGVSRALARATIDFARDRGARALEGYPMDPPTDREIIWGELFVGSLRIFQDAGFTEITRPTLRRVVMRIDF